MKSLSLIITTYNRKEPLLNMLKSIEAQNRITDYDLIIANNCSNYNVEEWVKQHVAAPFFENIRFLNRPYNIGGDLNIAFSFQLCQTKWMWLLSDDDFLANGALDIVLNDIQHHSHVATLKYAIAGYKPNKACQINTLDQFFDYYIDENHTAGEMIFMSNNVFNLEILNPYLGSAPMAAHTYMSQLVPTFLALLQQNAWVVFSPAPIVHYHFSGSSYNISKAEAGFANIIPFLELNKRQASKVKTIFRKRTLIFTLINLEKVDNRYLKRLLFTRIFNNYYSLLNFKDLFYFIVFYICDVCRIKLSNILGFYRKLKNNESPTYS